MDLLFPALNGGQAQGLNDAGVETFTGSVDPHLARECGQNTGDAKLPDVSAAQIEFHRMEVPADQVPGFARLRAALSGSREFWLGHEKEEAFFAAALEMSRQKSIPVLRISDYGTYGLTGSDTDRLGRWYALVKSQGLSNKGGTSAGSFGIGKSSPFAASRFRTVFYGTRTVEGNAAVQGVCRLVTHKGPDGKKTQGTGFIGDYDHSGDDGEPLFRAVRTENDIPPWFRRSKPGTDIWVVGYRSGAEWANELTRSILSNFWPAIHFGQLVFKVGDTEISRATYERLVAQHAGSEGFTAHLYSPAVASQPIIARVPSVGLCELYLATGNVDFPKRLCMVRGSGMRIYDHAPKACRVPFTGLFRCVDEEGNKLLRQLEPPRHDAWEPGRIEGTAGRRALDAIKGWIREEVKKLNPFYAGRSFNETELAKYLPEDADNDAPELEAGEIESTEPSLEPRASVGIAPVRSEASERPVVAPGSEPDDTSGDGSGGSEPDGAKDGRGDTPGSGSGGGADPGGRRAVKLQVRSFAAVGEQAHTLVLRSDAPFAGGVSVIAVGEDGEREPIRIVDARVAGSGEPLAVEKNVIRGIVILPERPTVLAVKIDAASRRALVVVGLP